MKESPQCGYGNGGLLPWLYCIEVNCSVGLNEWRRVMAKWQGLCNNAELSQPFPFV